MLQAVYCYFVGQANLFADFLMGLIGAGTNTATIGKVGGSADILMLSADCIIFFFDNTLA